MPKCIMLVGLPGVGKTTWLQKNQSNMPDKIVSSDYYIEEAAKLFGTTYSEIFPHVIQFAENAFNKHVETLAFNGNDFVIDRTNLSPNSRSRVMSIVKKNKKDYKFEAIVFNPPDSRIHMDRLSSRHGKHIPIDVMENMRRIYRVPNNSEGFSEIRFMEI